MEIRSPNSYTNSRIRDHVGEHVSMVSRISRDMFTNSEIHDRIRGQAFKIRFSNLRILIHQSVAQT